MKPSFSCVGWVRSVILSGILLCGGWCWHANSQANSWTNSVSGYWEEQQWSLGLLPGSDQNILFTNAGWKALGIGPNTAQNFPQTLNVRSITVSSPANSFNTLLLNYAGFQTPLTARALTVGSNSAVVALSSALQVTGDGLGRVTFSIGGTFNQGDFSTVTAYYMSLGDTGPGVYNLTNGLVSMNMEFIGGGDFPAVFNHFGGTNASSVRLLGGEYDLFDGYFSGSVTLGSFKQFGGVFSGGLDFNSGTYLLAGGTFYCSELNVPNLSPPPGVSTADGYFVQTGGTNFCGPIVIYGGNVIPLDASGSYTLSNGALFASGTIAVEGSGSFRQWGGVHTNAGVSLFGGRNRAGVYRAVLTLGGGMFSTAGLAIDAGDYGQTGGTNQISGTLSCESGGNGWGSLFNLSGGWLMAPNIMVTFWGGGSFTQSGGTMQISNGLTIWGATVPYWSGYVLSGGQLIAPSIQVDSQAIFHHTGGNIVNQGTVTLAAGTWMANTNQTELGSLFLGVAQDYFSGSNSTISLPAGPCILRFADSSSNTWSSVATLTVENWKGSIAGGGHHQVTFGNGVAALTSQQLGQIQFHNPGGSSGMFPAMILANGEIVPSQWLSSQPNGSALILQWGGGFTLQSATNVGGPYQDVFGAATAYTNRFSEPQRFFRLRKSSGMALIPAGSFTMGDTLDGDGYALPLHTVYVSAFYMDKYDVTKSLWDTVYQWAISNGYAFDYSGSGKAPNHPVQTIDWYDCVKWCNARSQMEGRTPAYYIDAGLTVVYKTGTNAPYVNWNSGYRLPTEAEWEKAARGGASGQRFPWGNTISWSQANYYADPLSAGGYTYDINPTNGYHPAFNDAVYPYTSPVGYFAANGYGLYDMAGNVWQWCWDWNGSSSTGSQSDPRGPASGSDRVFRGCSWYGDALFCRTARRFIDYPTFNYYSLGFRSVLPPGQ